MNIQHFQNQRIKLQRQISQDKLKLAKWKKAVSTLESDIKRAERLLAGVDKRLEGK